MNFHENESAMRILAPILIDLVLLHKTCRIWNSSPSGFAWALPGHCLPRYLGEKDFVAESDI